nr:integrase, catalytic region, zinc finger, CCHC-type, peptidase aspartic, catalytic [Tanacetum cinerariifolium]
LRMLHCQRWGNLDKMKEKGDECIFVGYFTQQRAYRVFNTRTRVIMESIHVNFDELPQMASAHNSSDPAPTCQTMASVQISSDPAPECQIVALEHDSLSPGHKCFSGVETPLFESMLAVRDVAAEAKAHVPAQGDDIREPTAKEVATDVVPPTPTSPSPSSPVISSSPPHQPPCPPQPQDAEDDVENVFNQGRIIVDMDQDEGIELVTDQEKDAEVEGRHGDKQAEIYNIDLDHSLKVLSMQEDDTEVQEAVEIVTTAKLMTEVVTVAAASTPIPAAKPKTLTITVARVVSTRKRKGVVIRDPEEELQSDTPAETPKVKDKGKGILIEAPKPMKKKDQIEMDAEYTRKLQEEINKEHEESYKNIDWNAALDHVQSKEPQYIKRYHRMKKKPQTESEAHKSMIFYLKNTESYKMDFFKGKKYDEILPIFQAKFDANMRKLREEAQEANDLRKRLEIVQDEDDDVFVEATLLAQKVPVVDYQIVVIDNKPKYQIIRVDDTHQFYISFTTLLKNFDREDLEALWKIVAKPLIFVRVKDLLSKGPPHEMVKAKKELNSSLALKAKKKSSDEDSSASDSEDNEYAMVVRDFKKIFKKCPKLSRNYNQSAFFRGTWSDSDEDGEEKTKDEKCLTAKASVEVINMPQAIIGDTSLTKSYTPKVSEILGFSLVLAQFYKSSKNRCIHEGRVVDQLYYKSNDIERLFTNIRFNCFFEINEPIVPRFILDFYSQVEVQTNEIPYNGQAVFINKWDLASLAFFQETEGPYHTYLPTPDDIHQFFRLECVESNRTIKSKNVILTPNQILTKELRQDMKRWEELIRENVFGLGGHRDHLPASLAHMLYCIVAEEQYNIAYFFVKQIECARGTPNANIPYGMFLTRLFRYVMKHYPHLGNGI